MKKTIDVQAAVAIAAGEAIAAKSQGTFGVGGVLLDQYGNVLKSLQNNVVRDGLIFDPTAHGERQLIDWYFAERAKGRKLPQPHDITLVTSLDPCAMCAGAILAAGFNVVVAANDPNAGINYDQRGAFPSLPPDCAQARRRQLLLSGGAGLFRLRARQHRRRAQVFFHRQDHRRADPGPVFAGVRGDLREGAGLPQHRPAAGRVERPGHAGADPSAACAS